VTRDRTISISANGPVEVRRYPAGTSLSLALADWAEGLGDRLVTKPIRRAPTIWCSWYHYFTEVTAADIDENIQAIDDAALPLDVIQIDDGYQAEIGDWLTLSDRFSDLRVLVERIRATGRRAGIWVAPFLVGARSQLMRDHPGWVLSGPDGPVSAGRNWDQEVFGLDLTHPEVREHLTTLFTTLSDIGFDFFKLDFLYAGALDARRWNDASPVSAYREGLDVIRAAVGTSSYLLGCGAPILPSIGKVDAMRVSPDTAPHFEPHDVGDLCAPAGRSSIVTGRGRAWQHGRWWVNDPDCLLTGRRVEQREVLAAHVERYGGLLGVSDRMADLDDWGLATLRRLCEAPPQPTPFSELPG
jgi:alpha-galactosidase